MAGCYPLILDPIFKEKVWGGRGLERIGKTLPPGFKIGESWELADLSATSASGGGGGSAFSIIANGELQGQTIAAAVKLWGLDLMGDVPLSPSGGFPLLIKYLDAQENLSVQVHPSIAYCKKHPEANLKTECWYILDAAPGAVIYKGVRAGVTRGDFERELMHGDGAGVVNLLGAVPAVMGECHNLPSGTVHALGAGVLVAEVQTPSDTTFRVYDWGRVGRELHIEQSMACISFEQAREATKAKAGEVISRLVTTGYFELDQVNIPAGEMFACGEGLMGSAHRPQALMLIAGRGKLRNQELRAGQTSLIAASIRNSTVFEASEDSVMLRSIVRGI